VGADYGGTASTSFEHSSGVQVGTGNVQNNTYYLRGESADVTWPVIEGEPPLLATAFQPRSTAQEHLAAALATSNSTTVVTQVLAGDGGVGKTQLAAQTFARGQAAGLFDLCLWVTAGSPDAIVTGFAAAMSRLTPQIQIDDLEAAARRFLVWLRETEHSWFIVLDDLRDPQDVARWWPSGPHGRTLVTTRRRDAILSEQGRILVDLGVFTPSESRDYLVQRLSSSQAHRHALVGASELSEQLGHLPLALAQAAAVILDDGLTCAEYLERLDDHSTTLALLFPAPLDDRQRTVSATWSLAIEAAERLPPPGCNRALVTLVSVLDPNGIPEQVLLTDATRRFIASQRRIDPSSGSGRQIPLADLRSGVRALHRMSLVVHDPADPARSVRMHALAQRAAREATAAEVLQATYRAAADALLESWPSIERDSDLSSVLRQNATTLAGVADQALWWPSAHPLLSRAGGSLGDVGLIKAAIEYFERMVTLADSRLGADHPDTLSARADLAEWRAAAGDDSYAVHALTNLLDDQRRVLGAEHPDTLATLHGLAYHRGEIGDVLGAATAFADLLVVQTRILGQDHPDTLRTRGQVAWWRGQAGDASGAVAAFTSLTADKIRILGAEHPEVLTSRAQLADWTGHNGHPADAVDQFQRLLLDRERILGPEHPATLVTRSQLASWIGAAGNPAASVARLEELLSVRVRVLGPDHPEVLITRDHLARRRGEARDAITALREHQELFLDRLRILGPDHPGTLKTRSQIARWRGENGDVAGAVAALADLLEQRARILGPEHPHTLVTRYELARWHGEAGDTEAAISGLTSLLTDRLRILGPEHPHTLWTRNRLAYWHGLAGDNRTAVTSFEDVLTDYLRILGPDHPDTLLLRHDLAYMRGEAGDATGAATALTDLLADRVRVLGPEHPDTLWTRISLARWQGLAGGNQEALIALNDVLTDCLRTLGPDHPDTLIARYHLAHTQAQAGDTPHAAIALEVLLNDMLRIIGPDHPDTRSAQRTLARLQQRNG
jgi:hypothetical protein